MAKFDQTVMYSQLQPWSTAGAPPCMEPVSGPAVPPRVGAAYQVRNLIYFLLNFNFFL